MNMYVIVNGICQYEENYANKKQNIRYIIYQIYLHFCHLQRSGNEIQTKIKSAHFASLFLVFADLKNALDDC